MKVEKISYLCKKFLSMKRILIILCAIVLAAASLSAQEAIRWRMSVKMTSDTQGVVTLRALIGDGWHLYGTKLPENGPKPTVFSFDGSAGISFTGPLVPSRKPLTVDDKMFGMQLSWWDANVEFTRTFKVDKKDGAKIVAGIEFMGCNDKTCLPPKKQTLTYQFK